MVFRFVSIAIAGLTLLALAVWVGGRIADKPISLEQCQEHWGVCIDAVGVDEAYTMLKTTLADMPIYERHDEAHAFGNVLYRHMGIGGLSVCGLETSGGCLHELFSNFLQEFGAEALSGVSQICDSYTQERRVCGHGIGHGLYVRFGYTSSVEDALHACEKANPDEDVPNRCYGGVFMEHNMRTTKAQDVGPRLYEGNPFEPCSQLKEKQRPACLFWQSQWWNRTIVAHEEPQVAFRIMGNLCRDESLSHGERIACFEGLGFITPFNTRPDVPTSRELCDVAGAENDEAQFACRVAGAIHFRDFDTSLGEQLAMCDGLRDEGECRARVKSGTQSVAP